MIKVDRSLIGVRVAGWTIAWLLLAGWAWPAPPVGSAEPFREDDVACFIGDSITHGGSYSSLVSLFYATRFPALRITWCNAGISGDRAVAIVADKAFRVNTDILGRRPTVATVMLGMNDIERGNYGAAKTGEKFSAARAKALATYERSMLELITLLQGSGSRVILLAPSPYDNTAVGPVTKARFMSSGRENAIGANAALGFCAELGRAWSLERHTGLVDFHSTMNEINRHGQERDPAFTLISVDRIHPGVPGHFVMAYTFLKAQGLEGPVAIISVDAATGATGASVNCEVSRVRVDPGRVEFDVLGKSLPFPVPDEAKAALDLVPFAREFNQERLVVPGLAAGPFRLAIDDRVVGEFSAIELEQGVNLAFNSSTPQFIQAAEAGQVAANLMEAVIKQRDVASNYYAMSKEGVVTANPAAVRAEVERKLAGFAAAGKAPDARFQRLVEELADPGKFQREEAQANAALRKACQPRVHRFLLTSLRLGTIGTISPVRHRDRPAAPRRPGSLAWIPSSPLALQ